MNQPAINTAQMTFRIDCGADSSMSINATSEDRWCPLSKASKGIIQSPEENVTLTLSNPPHYGKLEILMFLKESIIYLYKATF